MPLDLESYLRITSVRCTCKRVGQFYRCGYTCTGNWAITKGYVPLNGNLHQTKDNSQSQGNWPITRVTTQLQGNLQKERETASYKGKSYINQREAPIAKQTSILVWIAQTKGKSTLISWIDHLINLFEWVVTNCKWILTLVTWYTHGQLHIDLQMDHNRLACIDA